MKKPLDLGEFDGYSTDIQTPSGGISNVSPYFLDQYILGPSKIIPKKDNKSHYKEYRSNARIRENLAGA